MKNPNDPTDRTGTPVPGSGTSALPVYRCEACRDSGLVSMRALANLDRDSNPDLYDYFVTCPACDGKPRLCGEVDEPTPALDAQRNIKFGGPA